MYDNYETKIKMIVCIYLQYFYDIIYFSVKKTWIFKHITIKDKSNLIISNNIRI